MRPYIRMMISVYGVAASTSVGLAAFFFGVQRAASGVTPDWSVYLQNSALVVFGLATCVATAFAVTMANDNIYHP